MARHAIILGGAGFIGRHVARALAARGYVVAGLGHGDWDPHERAAWGVTRWRNDNVSETAIAALAEDTHPDVLVQCAGSGSVAASLYDPSRDYVCNVETTRAALEYIRRHAPACRFILPSSAAVYGQVTELPIRVDTPLSPVSPYGTHKAIGEMLTRSYAWHFDVPAIIVRLFSIYGPGLRKQLLWDACGKLMQGTAIFSGSGNEERDWLHVEDAAALLVAAIDRAASSCPTVNGGTGMSTRIGDVIGWLRQALGTIEPVQFDGVVRAGDPNCYRADVSMLTDWDWRPERRLLEEIPRYAHWYTATAA